MLGESIRDGEVFDEAFCRRVEQRICAYALPVSEACNARFTPPAPHTIEAMVAAAHNKAVANAYADGFNHPDRWWEIISNAEQTAAFLRQCGWQGMPAAARAA